MDLDRVKSPNGVRLSSWTSWIGLMLVSMYIRYLTARLELPITDKVEQLLVGFTSFDVTP